MSKSAKKFAIGAAVGAVAGFITGILTAPKSGKETREDIKEIAVTTTAEAEKRLKQLHTELNTLLNDAREKTAVYEGKAKSQLNDLLDKAGVVKEKARMLLSAIHEGDVDDKDLQKALDDTTKAIKHIKSFLTK